MSRCFPYPPPGHTPSLIESIGCGKDTEKKKKKKHKREKAEKIKHSKNVQRKDDVMSTKEDVERSCITDEHGDPSNYESDCSSPQITGKRKSQGLCSSPPNQKRLKHHHVPTSRDNVVEFATSVGRADNDQNLSCPISRQYKEMRKAALQYRDLIENWNPPAFSVFLDADCDNDWLSATKKPVNHPPEKDKTSSSSTLWPPRARFLPDADIYALPYVMCFPFD